MAKSQKNKTTNKPHNLINELSVDVKVGILHTIADAIYATTSGKIREAVANGRDNEATWMIIVLDQSSNSLGIFDNGTGITKKRFREIFKSIGYAFLGREEKQKLSYFGLGLMSIFQLGKHVKIFTRPRDKKQMYKLEVKAESIFNKENEDKSISSLSKYIKLTETNEETRNKVSAPLLNKYITEDPFKNSWDSFTHIIIEDINKDDLAKICETDFVSELSKWLPLKPEIGEAFLKRFTGKKAREVKKLLDNKEYCKTIDVYFGSQEEDTFKQLWKYFPSFRSDIVFPDDNVISGTSEDKEYTYYFVHSVAEDLHRPQAEEKEETGFWIRNQNFLVKSGDFLEKPGPGRKIATIDKPLKGWVYGEIFHKDMNQFLTVSRNDFLFEKNEFKLFQKEIQETVRHLNQELREVWKKRKDIVTNVIEPFTELVERGGAIERTCVRLKDLLIKDENLSEEQIRCQIFEELEKARKPEIENESSRIDKIIKKSKRSINLGEDEDAVVKIDPDLKGRVQKYDVKWDSTNKKVIVSISPEIFEPQDVVFLGETFTIYYVAETKESPGVSIDTKGNKIYVNPFNQELSQYSLSILDVYIALFIANSISNNKDELIKNTLSLLGTRSDITQRYVAPLGDDLRRTLRIASSGD